jgi:hypothetical protein
MNPDETAVVLPFPQSAVRTPIARRSATHRPARGADWATAVPANVVNLAQYARTSRRRQARWRAGGSPGGEAA